MLDKFKLEEKIAAIFISLQTAQNKITNLKYA